MFRAGQDAGSLPKVQEVITYIIVLRTTSLSAHAASDCSPDLVCEQKTSESLNFGSKSPGEDVSTEDSIFASLR